MQIDSQQTDGTAEVLVHISAAPNMDHYGCPCVGIGYQVGKQNSAVERSGPRLLAKITAHGLRRPINQHLTRPMAQDDDKCQLQ